jgi:dihydrofolate reductase
MGIGLLGKIPWYLPEERSNFEKIIKNTSSPGLQNAVIMGRKTWESVYGREPLDGVINAVISSNPELDLPEGVLQFLSLDEAILALSTSRKVDQLFVIGGGQLYAEAVLHPQLDKIYLTQVEEDYDCDTFFPDDIPEEFDIVAATEVMESDGLEYTFVVLGKNPDLDNLYFQRSLPD